MTESPKTMDEVCDDAARRILPAENPGFDLKALIKKLQRVRGADLFRRVVEEVSALSASHSTSREGER